MRFYSTRWWEHVVRNRQRPQRGCGGKACVEAANPRHKQVVNVQPRSASAGRPNSQIALNSVGAVGRPAYLAHPVLASRTRTSPPITARNSHSTPHHHRPSPFYL
ncbi:hypothetical protein J1614_000210 [Plenodomus biglobosus]|nr:hypothetical protein J1614_000210 [Plenodomus biglobosus]